MKKLATKLTPAIKAWIKEEFKSYFYNGDSEESFFHFPNCTGCNGFKEHDHLSFEIEKDYTLVSEQEFLNEFNTKKPKRGDLVLVRDRNGYQWIERIFLAEIVGANHPYLVVSHGTEEEFKNNEPFNHTMYKQMKFPTLEKITIEEANDILKQFNKQI